MESRLTKERALVNAEGSELMMELFNRMPVEDLKVVPESIAKRIGDFMIANGYRIVFNRWFLQADPKEPERPAHEPGDGLTPGGYSQEYAHGLRQALARIVTTEGKYPWSTVAKIAGDALLGYPEAALPELLPCGHTSAAQCDIRCARPPEKSAAPHVHDWQPKDGLMRCSTCLEER